MDGALVFIGSIVIGGFAIGDIVIGGNVGSGVVGAGDVGVAAASSSVSESSVADDTAPFFGMRHLTLLKQLYPLGHGCHRLHVCSIAQFDINSS